MTSKRVEELFAHVAERQNELIDRSTSDAALRQALGRHAERPRRASGSRRRALRGWMAAAAILPGIIGLCWWVLRGNEAEPLRFSVGGRAGVLHAWESAAAPQQLSLDFSDGTRFSLAPGARARVVGIDPRGAEVVIESGRALVEVVPHLDRLARWRVRTGPFEVEVKGTRFDVGWDPRTEEFSLQLFDGKVNVSGCGFGAGLEVHADQEAQASCRRPGFVLRPLSASPNGDVSAAPEPAAPLDAALTQEPRGAALAPPGGAAPSSSVVPGARSRLGATHRRWLQLAQRGHFESAYELVEPVFDAECAEARVSEVLLLADAARHAGHADRARVAYLVVRRRAEGTAAAAAAAFALGRLDFDDDLEGASRWLELSLAEGPREPLAQAARDRLLEAAVRIGDPERLRHIAARYLKESPQGPRAGEARAILKRGDALP